jgi:hypothetical protein
MEPYTGWSQYTGKLSNFGEHIDFGELSIKPSNTENTAGAGQTSHSTPAGAPAGDNWTDPGAAAVPEPLTLLGKEPPAL